MNGPLRAEDFRKAWPNALAIALQQAGDLAEKLDTQQGRMVQLAQVTPRLITAAELRLEQATQRHVEMIEAASQRLAAEQREFLDSFARQYAALEKARAQADAQRAEIARAQQILSDSRRAFNSKPLLARLFARA